MSVSLIAHVNSSIRTFSIVERALQQNRVTADFFYMLLSVICVEQEEPIHSHELLGPFHFHMAYLPWVLLGFSILVGASAWVDLLGSYQVAKWNAIKVSIEIIDKDGHADPESIYMSLRSSAYFPLVLPNFVC
ncbi:hypothetical protein OROMI_006152 [Orobanche minor]